MKTLRTFVVLTSLIALSACMASRLTEDNLQKIHNGMAPDEVKAILGEPTSSQTGNMLGVISGTTYVYHTDKSDVKITFVNDKVISTEGTFQ
jgi:outer membrane protein assembly factor BamE (lipoprotein component of BamABCDE complex)